MNQRIETMTKDSCPDRETLEQFLEQRLETSVLGQLESHVERCTACQDALEELVASSEKIIEFSPDEISKAREIAFALPRDANLNTALPDVNLEGVRVIRSIGKGGMGAVYEVEQSAPLRRRAALKLLYSNVWNSERLARFQRECNMLAGLEHVHIARLYDAGVTEHGIPWMLMEYVDGEHLIDYCDHRALDVRQRIEVFIQVCDAVQHLHRKQVIHRDLKPGNILVQEVDSKPCVKLIDFGLARPTGHDPAATELTIEGSLLGTLRYMSPEQASRTSDEMRDTTVDIYSLGTILYQLLTGDTPLRLADIRSHSLIEILSRIQSDEIQAPSQRIRQLQRTTKTQHASHSDELADSELPNWIEPHNAERQFVGDIDAILLKALDRVPESRYSAAGMLADDLRAHLNDLPISAPVPSRFFAARKFVRRHRTAILILVGFALLLLAGTVGTGIGLYRAIESEKRAAAEAKNAREAQEQAEQTLANLRESYQFVRNILDGLNPKQMTSDASLRAQLVQQIKDTGSAMVAADLPPSEDVALLQMSLVQALSNLGEPQEAIPLLESILATLDQIDIATVEDQVAAMAQLGMLYSDSKDHSKAVTTIKNAIELSERELADTIFPAFMRHYLAIIYNRSNQLDLALELQLEITSQLDPDIAEETTLYLDAMNELAILYQKTQRYTEALETIEVVVDYYQRQLPKTHPMLIQTKSNRAIVLDKLQRSDEALAILQENCELMETIYPADAPNLLDMKISCANTASSTRQYDLCESLLDEVDALASRPETKIRSQLARAQIQYKSGETSRQVYVQEMERLFERASQEIDSSSNVFQLVKNAFDETQTTEPAVAESERDASTD